LSRPPSSCWSGAGCWRSNGSRGRSRSSGWRGSWRRVGCQLRDVNLSETAQKEDWRGAYEQIAAHRHPNDALIIQPGYLETTLDYYALRDARLRDLPILTIPNEFFDARPTSRRSTSTCNAPPVGYERIWMIVSPDRLELVDPFDRRGDCEGDRLRNWYCYNAHRLVGRELNGLWLGLYAYSRPYAPPSIRPRRSGSICLSGSN
jgi:hypothetical protein